MKNLLTAALIDPLQIVILEARGYDGEMVEVVTRADSDKVADDALRRSIMEGGIQQPLVLVSDGERLLLADGLRRLKMARELGIPKVPVVIEPLPADQTTEAYIRQTRFILDEHRQDLTATQKGEFFHELKKIRGFSNDDLAKFLGLDSKSIYNFLAVLKYIKPVQLAMDAGRLSMRAARVFNGMTDDGQQAVWKDHEPELVREKDRAQVHRRLRAKFSPDTHPEFYRSVKTVKERMGRGFKARVSGVALEKKKLLGSMAAKEAELEQAKKDIARDEREIRAAAPIVAALLRDRKLRALVPEEMLPELERFAEVYC